MASTTIDIAAPPEAVWSVLGDADAYGEWVVGTRSIARADAEWPSVDSALEYELGFGPIRIGDRTVVVEADPPRLLVLRAEFSHFGAASIRLQLERHADGTRVVMDEEPVEGLVETVHSRITDAVLGRRNEAALERLKRIVEERG